MPETAVSRNKKKAFPLFPYYWLCCQLAFHDHKLDAIYLQNYIDEFINILNRRNSFDL